MDRVDVMGRLRAEGKWTEASAYRETIRRKLRAEGVPKALAKDRAWEEMLVRFPRCINASKTYRAPAVEPDDDQVDEIFIRLRDDPAPVPLESIDRTVDEEFLAGRRDFISVMIDRWAKTNGVTVPMAAAAILQAKVLGLVLADGVAR